MKPVPPLLDPFLDTPLDTHIYRLQQIISVAFNYKGIKCNEMPFSEQKPPDIIEWNITQLENNCK